MSSTATYLYCIVHSQAAPPLARVPAGLPGATRPRLVSAGGSLRIVVADVPLDRYGPGPLEEGLRDMRWVGDVAVAHESVVEHLSRARGTTVIPMKLFTMFSSADRAVASVKARRKELAAVVARVGGCAEWGVRVTRRPSGRPSARTERAASGAAFLAAKKRARDDARAAVAVAGKAAEQVLDALASISRATHRRDMEPEGVVTPPLLDAAFLVPASRLAKFKAAARRAAADCARAGAEMTLTGPWPPYNFVQRGGGS